MHCSGAISGSQPCSFTSQWSYIDPLSTGVRKKSRPNPASVQKVRERGFTKFAEGPDMVPSGSARVELVQRATTFALLAALKAQIILPNSTWLE